MKFVIVRLVFGIALLGASGVGQEVIPLYPGAAPGSPEASYPEKDYFSKLWGTQIVTNVTKPTLTLYKPAAGTANGSAIVICPGGGFMALSINSEGIDVAKWLAGKGMTAFVLKYRLAHSGEDAAQEFNALYTDKEKFGQVIHATVPLAIDDGLAAVKYVRAHAADWGVSADKVGIIGFSAGGTVAAAAGLRYTPEGRPTFVAPIYAAASLLKDAVPADAPPMFLAAATDDQLGLSKDSIDLYERWAAAHKSVELHMYAKGGHGFGMRKQGSPSDEWIDRFGDWLAWQGWLKQ